MKALIINDTTNWYHFGCMGTSTALKREIEGLGVEVSSFSIVDCNNLTHTPSSIDNFFDPNGIEKFILGNAALCEFIRANDVIIINGEGTLHGIKKGPLTLLYVAYLSKNIFFKNVQIVNHSVYPCDTLSMEDNSTMELYKKVYSSIDFIAIREPLSLDIMRNVGLDAHESFDCLPLYIKHYYKPQPAIKQKDLILISGTAAWFNLNIFVSNAKMECALQDGLEQITDVLKTKISQGHRVKFLYSDIKYPAKDDQEMISILSQSMGRDFSILNATSVDTWLDHIAEADLLISGRFHHTIAAACLGTRFIALNSNTPKISGLMKSIGYPKPIMYSDRKLGKNLQDLINKSNVSESSTDMLENLCRKAQNNFLNLRRLLHKL